MIVDCHVHAWRYPRDFDEVIQQDVAALAARISPGMATDLDVPLDRLETGVARADRVLFVGLRAPQTGFLGDNEDLAAIVRLAPGRYAGLAGIDPHGSDVIADLERARGLGLKGIKLSGVYQHFDPADRRFFPIYDYCQQHNWPIMWHQSPGAWRRAAARFVGVYCLDEVAREFPRLRIIIAHCGYPQVVETATLMRKQPNVYADISGGESGMPFRYYQAMTTFWEWGVSDKLLLGSDFPWVSTAGQIDFLYRVERLADEHNLPRIPRSILNGIVHENAWRALGDLFEPAGQ